MFVLDASVTMTWCFREKATPYTWAVLDRLNQTGTVVPAIWPLEVANVLITGERRGRLTESQTLQFVALLQELPITVDSEALPRAFGALLPLGREHGLSVYDASYLELAARRSLSLATKDARLSAAAARMGVALLA